MARMPVGRILVAAALVLAACLAALLVASPPDFVRSWFASEKPASVAGEPVPKITTTPPVRLAIAGDTGTGNADEQATADRMVEESREVPYDALVLLGDLVYPDGDVDLVDEAVTEPFAPLLKHGAELVPVLGNHDYYSGDEDAILEALGRDRSWYVETVGPVRIIALDSNRIDDPSQTAWLRETLAEPQPARRWTLVAMHHPPYSSGHHGSSLDVREAWSGLFAAADVPLVLAGHDHNYERTTPQDGVTYVVSGAGAKLRDTGHEDFTAVSTSTLHFLDLLVYDSRIVGRAIDHHGRLLDIFTVRP